VFHGWSQDTSQDPDFGEFVQVSLTEKTLGMECPPLGRRKKISLLFEDLNDQAKVVDPDLAGLGTPDLLLLSVGALDQQMRVSYDVGNSYSR